jgi:hypothetical protein
MDALSLSLGAAMIFLYSWLKTNSAKDQKTPLKTMKSPANNPSIYPTIPRQRRLR